jgi:hypothetical protein
VTTRTKPQPRRIIIQIATKASGEIVALDNEGNVWLSRRDPQSRIDDYSAIIWDRLAALPEPEANVPA